MTSRWLRDRVGDLLDGVRQLCLALAEVTEGLTHGAETWFVRGRRSLLKFVDPRQHRFTEPHVAIWAAAPPGSRAELVAADPTQFFGPPSGGRGRWRCASTSIRALAG